MRRAFPFLAVEARSGPRRSLTKRWSEQLGSSWSIRSGGSRIAGVPHAKTHGVDELRPINATVRRLGAFVARHDGPSIWVRALYKPGQGAPPGHPLADLCTSLDGLDCAWDPRLRPPAHAVVVTKHYPDALTSADFASAFDDLVSKTNMVIISGFTLPTCVAATAISCAWRLDNHAESIVVPLTLSGSRAGNFRADDVGESRVEATIRRLRKAGVSVLQSHNEL